MAADAAKTDSLRTKQKELKRQATYFYRQGDVYKAIEYFQSYLELNHKDVKSTYRLASLYYETRDYRLAKNYFDSVISKSPGKYPLSKYYRGVVLMNMQEYQKAEQSFVEFRKTYNGLKDKGNYRRKAQVQIDNCVWAQMHIDSIENIAIDHLDSTVNQPHIEFSPFLLNENTLVYGSLRDDKRDLRKLYMAEKQGQKWVYEKPFDDIVNEGYIHTGNAVFSADGQRMYFTRCEKNWQNKLICSIYKSEFIDNRWQEPQRLPYPVNDENYTATQPALGNNLRTGSDILYFVSDRPGTRGGLDIWYTETDKQTGEYKEPKNLGKAINTYDDECSPFYDVINRNLYFSSKGHPGFGGFDVFRSTGSAKQWTDALPLPKPINSSYDDTYFSTNSGTQGFFTSNRPGSFNLDNGSCCDDIFFFRYNDCVKATVVGKVVNSTNYDFFREVNSRYRLDLEYPKDNIPVEGVPIFVYSGDSIRNELLVSQTKSKKDGSFSLELDMGKDYSLIVKNYGFFDKKLKISTKAIDCTDTIMVGITPVNYIPEITVRVNVYYEHDKSKLLPKGERTLDTALLPLFDLLPNAIVEIGSHTDSTGTDSYNMKLSQRRSESVVNYLVSKGISIDRLIAKGYGESRPIAPNTNPDGTDNPENRALNRRTELKIVGQISSFYHEE